MAIVIIRTGIIYFALLLAMRLKAVDKKEGYGLEEPNIKE